MARASFGLEAAATLRHRKVEVHVVGPKGRPMERVLGQVLGDFMRSLRESHGVVFHLGHVLAGIDSKAVTLDSGERLRIEHWVVAERQGQTAARNMSGSRERFSAVPFFWTQHYDVSLNYVGHAAAWDTIEQSGDLNARDAALRYRKGGRTLAVAKIFRDLESPRAELAMEEGPTPPSY